MKSQYFYTVLFIILIASNFLLGYKNYNLKSNLASCEKSRDFNFDNTIHLEELIESKKFRCQIETAFSLSTNLNSIFPYKNEKTLLFLFHEYDCDICISKVLKDLKNIELPIIIGGDFSTQSGFLNFKERYGLGNNFYRINYFDELNFSSDSHKPFLFLVNNNTASNVFIINKVFDKAYYYYMNELIK